MMFYHVCQFKYKAIQRELGACSCAAAVFQKCYEEDGWIVCPACGKLEEIHDTSGE